jgi:hypothetical protein
MRRKNLDDRRRSRVRQALDERAQVAVVLTMIAAGAASSEVPAADRQPVSGEQAAVIVIQSFERGLAATRTANPDVKLSIGQDAALPGQWVLLVEYPAPTSDPAARDVWCDAENVDWTRGRAISFQVRSEHDLRLSVSFLDRNGVAYTSWTDLLGETWQTVRIPFDEIRPNPYFQPPGAKKGAPIDVSEVRHIGFSPQDQNAGRFAISRFVVVR